uniref:NADH-ubiquinone oxidoreductase chain 6 n=2 Tax=Sprattus TaxID=196074 RepID=H1UCN5_9TELE|nr:NADH dehydrogenase subunit 6 [Sprattus muelleri]YP_005087888.1 NADH dehydrogenase subunit 6 [Sprattus antipodum]BAL43906.1 NADH dehydrogenase subunit 6 [Sprattus muelleri]BAL43919.1 NADH dehydrogenase subunit 6 [Sprattus antipodum]
MLYFTLFLLVGLVLGLVAVACNPAPYFAAFGLVVAAGMGCAVLAVSGAPFLALVLFLIYLGGMLVVFAYSSALAADPFPEGWTEVSVFEYMALYVSGLVVAVLYFGKYWYGLFAGMVDGCSKFFTTRADMGGVIAMYGSGGYMLIFCVWVLLLTLFVVLELVRGLSRGPLRAV